MADEQYRRFHSGRYPAVEGGTGQASYVEGSKTGYFEEDPSGQPMIDSVENNIDLTATKALRKIVGFSDDGESGVPMVTRNRLKQSGEK
jgi:hypothetical protein